MRMNIFGVITLVAHPLILLYSLCLIPDSPSVSAQYLPFCLIGFSWTMSGIKAETMGDAVRTYPFIAKQTRQDPFANLEATHHRSDLSRVICIIPSKMPGRER